MTAPTFTLLFGSYADVEPTRDFVEHSLSVAFTRHESAYRGGDYWLGVTDIPGEQIVVQANAELEEPMEPINCPTLVYVERTSRPDDVMAAVRGGPLEFVRRDEWPES